MARALQAGRAACVACLAAATTLLPYVATAAVRLCENAVSSGPVVGTTEKAGRKAALAIWKSRALVYGEPYASWRIAADKILKCFSREAGGYECLASARPCTIEQAPGRRELRQKRLGI